MNCSYFSLLWNSLETFQSPFIAHCANCRNLERSFSTLRLNCDVLGGVLLSAIVLRHLGRNVDSATIGLSTLWSGDGFTARKTAIITVTWGLLFFINTGGQTYSSISFLVACASFSSSHFSFCCSLSFSLSFPSLLFHHFELTIKARLAIIGIMSADPMIVATNRPFLSWGTSIGKATGAMISHFLQCVLLVTYADFAMCALGVWVKLRLTRVLSDGCTEVDEVQPTCYLISARWTVCMSVFWGSRMAVKLKLLHWTLGDSRSLDWPIHSVEVTSSKTACIFSVAFCWALVTLSDAYTTVRFRDEVLTTSVNYSGQ